MTDKQKLGISGRIAATFQLSAITPLLALLGLLLGIFAVLVTPKEEEPQIDVTFADVYIPFAGASPAEVESLVTLPTEQIISELKGIDTLYSFSQPDGALFIVIFEVGIARNDAIVKLYNQIHSNLDKLPLNAGVGQPLIKPRGIDDVPIVSLTLWSKESSVSAEQLTHVANSLETEIKRIPGTREINSVGAHQLTLNVRIDPVKMNYYGISYNEIHNSLSSNNHVSMPASLVQQNQEIKVQTGEFLTNIDDVKQLVVAIREDSDKHTAPVFLADIADITLKADIPVQSAWHGDKENIYPAVTIAIGKQPGVNAVDIADAILERVDKVDNILLPDGVNISVSRNYGETAGNKANTLILKLMFATSAVVILVLLTMGFREALVVGIAIVITLALTLFASWAWGFTLNRISLFALIFSIGILVDDAIVVVENIHRHMAMGKRTFTELIPIAVDEVGGPTILATFTVIAALLPMAFVSGLMGPYMSPIPINASMGMLISLAVAFMVTPWLSRKLLKHDTTKAAAKSEQPHTDSLMLRVFTRLIGPFVIGKAARKARFGLAAAIFVLIAIAVALPIGKLVVLKMLPFDNKSEFQIIVDLPEGTPVEQTQRTLKALAQHLNQVEEVDNYQIYAGTSAPMNFNGLLRHYFLRQTQELGDIQVNLVDKQHRERDSHSIAIAVRAPLQEIAKQYNANVKIVEVPPGPPVWSPILAEVYGPSAAIRERAATALEALFKQTTDVVDIDIYLPANQAKWQVNIDRSKASLLGIQYSQIVDLVATSIGGKDISYLHAPNQKHPVPIRIQLKEGDKFNLEQVLNLTIKNNNGQAIAMSELLQIDKGVIDVPIIHKNMIPMIMVVADMAGPLDSPLYGMFDMVSQINAEDGLGFEQHYINQPTGLDSIAILWDGEWKVTYETFRDMGIAYAVGMIAIYLLVVAQFKSYSVPLIIMAPIPLTIIGVMPGHALLGAQFTATSMIGMIALAGIIVRNSILLVDFIHQEIAAGVPFEQAVIHSGAVRAKPIMLTALAAMIGALFILDDPIFNGLAISLIFGILVSTLLTLVVIPVLYYAVMKNRYQH
ncbi:efflux RND transporter permease subunit [Shewanella gelidimarina]|uniref:efflux RND transporter permease subunit n=1 Tax=Shewanella gelidimarina TaxID=56813 RepID=UPI00200FEE5C|nr:efflux RND transporter permease subunit [Shewanella gelidimarina]MCL1059321.1 efflux RND transporter permease subunit [Shewanella gelidimarina]